MKESENVTEEKKKAVKKKGKSEYIAPIHTIPKHTPTRVTSMQVISHRNKNKGFL